MLTGGGITIGLPIALTALITSVGAGLDSKLGWDKKHWGQLYDALGFEYSNEFSIANWKVRFNILMDIKDILFNNLETLLNKLKSWIKETVLYQISFLIKCMSDALGSFPVFGERLKEEGLKISKIVEKEAEKEKQIRKDLTIACQKNTDIIAGTEQLKNAVVVENTGKIKQSLDYLAKKYDELGEATGNSLSEQIVTQQAFADKVKSIHSEAGKKISEETRNSLDERTRSLADKLVEQTNKIEALTPEQIDAWKKLAEGSKSIYNEKISGVNEDIRLALETMMNTTQFLSPQQIQQWADLAQNNKQAYENNLIGLDETTRERIQSCVDAINNKQWTAEEAGAGLSLAIKNGINKIDTSEIGKNIVSGVAKGIEKNKKNTTITSAIKNFKNCTLQQMQEILGIHSPSTVMRDMVGKFIPLGIAEGINDNAKAVYNSMKNLSAGITVNPNDFKIDTNQFIDYGQISGAIATQNNIKVDSNIEGRIENAIYRGLSNATIPIEIEVTTDEGVIFKKVQVKAKEFYTQTGEPAFDF